MTSSCSKSGTAKTVKFATQDILCGAVEIVGKIVKHLRPLTLYFSRTGNTFIRYGNSETETPLSAVALTALKYFIWLREESTFDRVVVDFEDVDVQDFFTFGTDSSLSSLDIDKGQVNSGTGEILSMVVEDFRPFVLRYTVSGIRFLLGGDPSKEIELSTRGYEALKFYVCEKKGLKIDHILIDFGLTFIRQQEFLFANKYTIRRCIGSDANAIDSVNKYIVQRFKPDHVVIETTSSNLLVWANHMGAIQSPQFGCEVEIYVAPLDLHFGSTKNGFKEALEELFVESVRDALLHVFGPVVKVVACIRRYPHEQVKALKEIGCNTSDNEETTEFDELSDERKTKKFSKLMRAPLMKLHKLYQGGIHIKMVTYDKYLDALDGHSVDDASIVVQEDAETGNQMINCDK